MTQLVELKRALISVSDKTGLLELGRALADRGVELLSTGGSAKALREAGLAVIDVASLTGFPEMMDGRVKTLHPNVFGGILSRRELASDKEQLEQYKIPEFDLVIVDLYPFEKTVSLGASEEDIIEKIDIGGISLIRAAAKNFKDVLIVSEMKQYTEMLEILNNKGATTYGFRQNLALSAYSRTAAYDSAVSSWMAKTLDVIPRGKTVAGIWPKPCAMVKTHISRRRFTQTVKRARASLQQCSIRAKSCLTTTSTTPMQRLSWWLNFSHPSCVIVKHANPCGVASSVSLKESYKAAFQCDQTSAFGGIIALNQTLDGATAAEICKIFTEVVIAPDADEDARRIFAQKKNLRLLTMGPLPDVMRCKPNHSSGVWGLFSARQRCGAGLAQ